LQLARLLYSDSSGRQQAVELDPNRPQTVIGRQADCEVVAYDTSVSRRHCIVVPEDGGYLVVDLGSANGTLVNDVRITRRRLVSDDVIRCGVFAVRFIESPADSRESLADRYRRSRVGAAPDAALRVQLERLQAFNENQSQRLVQLQEELTRSEAERAAVVERLARADVEGRLGRVRIGELEEHLRRLVAVLEERERELDTLRAIPAPPPPSAPPSSSAPVVGPLAVSVLAAENVALQAQVASLHAALAVDEAYERAARLVPTVDRWQALIEARADIAAGKVERKALEARMREAEEWRRAVEERAKVAEARAKVAAERAQVAEERAKALDARARQSEPSPMPRRSLAEAVIRQGNIGGGLLAGLGGLGETARSGRTAGSAEPSDISPRARDVEERDVRIRELQEALRRSGDRRDRARADAELLIARLTAYREAASPSGMAALHLAELVDLGRAIGAALVEPPEE
jgi:hypothetical protein